MNFIFAFNLWRELRNKIQTCHIIFLTKNIDYNLNNTIRNVICELIMVLPPSIIAPRIVAPPDKIIAPELLPLDNFPPGKLPFRWFAAYIIALE